MKKSKSTYTLKELCEALNVSDSWIHKIEKYFGLRGWASNSRGKKSSYDQHKALFFSKVDFLRAARIDLEGIKKIYNLENKIIEIARKDFDFDGEELTASELIVDDVEKNRIANAMHGGDRGKVSYVEVYLLEGVYGGTDGIEFDMLKYRGNKETARKLDALKSEYKRLLQAAYHKASSFYKNMGKNLERLGGYAGV